MMSIQDNRHEIIPDAETSYKALRRAIQRGVGFSLLFVRCTPVKGEEIVECIKTDLPQKRIEVLNLDANTENLYHLVENLTEEQSFDVLFIRGLEESLFKYEDREQLGILGRSKGTGYGGNWEAIPRILGHLNLSRERFRDNFKICFVFLLPEFALTYFIRRAPDFFDWRSNVYEFPTERELVSQESYRLAYLDGSYDEYCEQLPEQRIAKLVKIKSYLEEETDPEEKSSLWLEKGVIHSAAKEYEEAIASYDCAIKIKREHARAWGFRGLALEKLGRHEEAIVSYDNALKTNTPEDYLVWLFRGTSLQELRKYEEAITAYDNALRLNPNHYDALDSRGIALGKLGRHEEAIICYDKALQINPVAYETWYGRGVELGKLEKYEESIASFDKVLELKPKYIEALNGRGIGLYKLGKYEEAIAAYDRAIEIKPDDPSPYFNKACAYSLQSQIELALENLQKAIQLDPEKYREMSKTDSDFDNIRHDPRFQALIK